MINYFIIYLLWAVVALSAVSAAAEMIFRRNSKPYHFFRAVWIRMREFSPFSFGVTTPLLLFWGLISGDDNFYGIWMSIAMMLTIVVILYAEDIFTFRKKRRKASKKTVLPARSEKTVPYTKEAPPAREAAVLTPMPQKNIQ